MNKATELEPLIWHNERRRIDELIPYDKNPRRLTKQQRSDLKDSISRFHLVEVPAINTDNTIVSGHMRLKVLSGIEGRDYEVDVRVPSRTLTEQEFKEYNIRANKNTGEFDFDILSSAFEYDDLQDWGFSDDELTDFTVDLIDDDSDADDVAPDKPEKARSQLGDIYELGNHRVMCGDSTDKEVVAALMNGDKADICFTSPPYNTGNNNLGGNSNMKSSKYLNSSDNKKDNEWLALISAVLLNMQKVTVNQCFNIQQLSNNKRELIEFLYKFRSYLVDTSIWNKGGGQPTMADSVMNSRFEYVFIFQSGSDAKRKIDSKFFRNVSNVFDYNPSGKNDHSNIHAAVFPLLFVEHYIGFLSRRSVVDPFLGSGTTLIACEKTKRRCYGMELDPQYMDVIVQRYVDYTGNNNIRLNGEDIEWGDNGQNT